MELHTLKLVLCLLLFTFSQGNSQSTCDITSIQINQTNIGKSSNSLDFIFEVEVKNICVCPVQNIVIYSLGFASSIPVDPKLFRQAGEGYLVNDGQPIASQMSVKFQYAWSHSIAMAPQGIEPQC